MIRILFFDMGKTLIRDGRPFPGVVAALTAISAFETVDGGTLAIGIISNFLLPSPPATEAKIAALEESYRDEVLGPSSLGDFFEPFESKVTISSRAGVQKPERKIFDVALDRIGAADSLTECLFVTEEAEHLKKCRDFGMTPLLFGPAQDGLPSFDDWADAPADVARLVASENVHNLAAAVGAALDLRHGLVQFELLESNGRTLVGSANRLVELNDPRLGPLNGVFAERPVEVQVDLDSRGRVASVSAEEVGPADVADAVNQVFSVFKSRRVELPGQPPSVFGTTHALQQDTEGRPRLVRRRFS